jgi:hypothetical protein
LVYIIPSYVAENKIIETEFFTDFLHIFSLCIPYSFFFTCAKAL